MVSFKRGIRDSTHMCLPSETTNRDSSHVSLPSETTDTSKV
jgi:hypothetical protein